MYSRSIFNFFLTQTRRSLFKFLFLSLITAIAQADRVGNGGGIAEQNVLDAYLNFSTSLKICLADKSCAGSKTDQGIIENILKSYETEKILNPDQIQFKSGREFPSDFQQNNCSRIWCTLSQSGSPIFFNTDEIVVVIDGIPKPISSAEARRSIFLALGVHQSNFDFFKYDRVAIRLSKVSHSTFSERNRTKSDFNLADPLTAQAWISMYLKNMDLILKSCLHSRDCNLTNTEFAIVEKILENHSVENFPETLLRFESGESNTSRFTIDGEIKAAVTGLNPQDVIYFNTDFLYKKVGSHQLVAIEPSTLLGLLIHELGHHTGIKNHNQLDQIGIKVGSFLNNEFPISEFVEDPQMSLFHQVAHFRSLILPSEDNQQKSRLILGDEVGFGDFSQILFSAIVCPAGQKLESYVINSAEWNGDFKYSGLLESVKYSFKGETLAQTVQMVIYNMNFDISQICLNEHGGRSFTSTKKNLPLLYSIHLVGDQIKDLPLRLYKFKRTF